MEDKELKAELDSCRSILNGQEQNYNFTKIVKYALTSTAIAGGALTVYFLNDTYQAYLNNNSHQISESAVNCGVETFGTLISIILAWRTSKANKLSAQEIDIWKHHVGSL